MKLTHLALKRLDIPFKTSFKHSSAARSQTESVIAIAESDNGRTGYGEGCPRHYVTGETIETAFEFFEDHRQTLIAIAGLDHLKEWMRQHKLALDKNPAAWCAVELALLDLLGKEQGKPVEAVLSLPEIAGPFYYTAVLGVASFQAFKKQYETYCNMGFTDFKIKVSGNIQEDKEKISLFNADSNSSRRVRLDANNLWENADEAIEVIRKMDYPFFAAEEPLSAEDYDGCLKLYNALNIPVILDESFKRIEQFESIRKNPEAWIINVRISKMGGLLRSLAIMENAEKAHICFYTPLTTCAPLRVTCKNRAPPYESPSRQPYLLYLDLYYCWCCGYRG